MMDNSKRKVIRSSRIAKQLLEQGERIIDISKDRLDPKRTVFVFEYTDTLDRLLTESKKEV